MSRWIRSRPASDLADLAALRRQGRGLGLHQLQGVDHLGARFGLRGFERRPHVDALLQCVDERLLGRDRAEQPAALRGLLGRFALKAADRAGELGHVVAEHALLAVPDLRRHIAPERDGRDGIGGPLRRQG